jgi:hypothetical protein
MQICVPVMGKERRFREGKRCAILNVQRFKGSKVHGSRFKVQGSRFNGSTVRRVQGSGMCST